jgi:hypothetical protein
MSTRGSTYASLWLVGLVLTIGATVAGFWLLGDGFENKSTNYWMSLGTMIFAEVLTFGVGISLSMRGGSDASGFPYQFTLVGMVTLYDIAIVILALLSLTDISSRWLATLHIAAFLLMAIGLIMYLAGGFMVKNIGHAEVRSRRGYMQLCNRMDALVQQATLAQHDAATHMRAELASCQDDLQYMTSETLPGTEDRDSDVLMNMQLLQECLSQAATSDGDVDGGGLIERFDESVTRLRLSLQKRESVMLQSRT